MGHRQKERVCILGSGNWGSAIAKIVGINAARNPEFYDEVNMWVYEETVDGEKLTDIINTRHENVKYLKGIRLPENVIAVPDLVRAAQGATLLVFVVPHQFVKGVCQQLQGKLAPGARAISLIKGLDTAHGLRLISDVIKEHLNTDVSVLMGANVAREVAEETFCETTIGYRVPENGAIFAKLFNTSYFRVRTIDDVCGVELCGALKNIVATAAGFVDGLGMGSNTKAAIMRIGLDEMRRFAGSFFEGVRTETFFESCGIADVITTCYGGRNARVAAAFAKTRKPLDVLEREMLNGQKLQGPLTAAEVYEFLKERNQLNEFPLFITTYRICYEGQDPNTLFTHI